VFTFQAREVFAPYAQNGRIWGPSPVTDLHIGGFVMLVGSDIVMSAAAVGIAVHFLRASRRARGDDDAHLAAYNAYLRALSDGGHHRDHRTVPGNAPGHRPYGAVMTTDLNTSSQPEGARHGRYHS
jgi:hypothetical protein